jgi:hypothetical protein
VQAIGRRIATATASSAKRARKPKGHARIKIFHDHVRSSDVFTRRLHATLAAAERGPLDFPELLLTPGVGARTGFAEVLIEK